MSDGTISLAEARRRAQAAPRDRGARPHRRGAHKCRVCHARRTLHLVHHPAGAVVVCEHCGDVRVVGRTMRAARPRLRRG